MELLVSFAKTCRSECNRSSRFAAALSLLFAGLIFSPSVMSQDATVIEPGSGTLDRDQGLGPRRLEFPFNALADGEHTVSLSWNSDADIRFRVFDDNNNPISPFIRDSNPGIWSGVLSYDELYHVAIWSASGVADFTVTVEAGTNDTTALKIISQPADLTVNEGDDALFTVMAAGSGTLSYQWFANGSPIPGASSSTLTLSQVSLADNENTYAVYVSDANGMVSSTNVMLRVIDGNSTIQTVQFGAGTLDADSVVAERWVPLEFNSLTQGEHTISVSWNSSADVKFRVFNENDDPLSPVIKGNNPGSWTGVLNEGAHYRIGLWSTSGIANYTATVEAITANGDLPQITNQPADLTVIEGNDAVFSVSTTGGTGALSYQWLEDGVDIPDATENNLSLGAVSIDDSGRVYSVRITNANGSSITSDNATLEVISGSSGPVTIVNIGQGAVDSDRNAGPRIVSIDFESLAAAEHTITVSWDNDPDADIQFRVFDSNDIPIKSSHVSGTNPGVWTGQLEADSSYYVNVWSAAGRADFTVTIEAIVSVSIQRQPSDLTVTAGVDADFVVEASGSGTLSYQWFADGTALFGETENTLTVFAATIEEDGIGYTVEISNGFDTVISELATLTVLQDLGPTLLTTQTSPSWELDLFRSPVSIRPNGRPTYEINEQAVAVLTIGDVVYVGGEFQNIRKGGIFAAPANKYIAAFNRNTGEPIQGFNIVLDGKVHALAASANEDTLYIGGSFNNADGQSRKNFAAYDIVNGNATLSSLRLKRDGINISSNAQVRDIAVTSNRLYLGGAFTKFGGNEDHAYVAAFDRDSGEIVKTFKPRPNKLVNSIIAGGDEGLWIGGEFLRLNGVTTVGLALVDPNTGALDSSSPIVPYPVIDLAATSTQLFVASGGQNRENRFTGNVAGAFNRTTLEKQWELQGDGNVQAVDVDEGRYVYFGGHYQRYRYFRNDETDPNGIWVTGGEQIERLSRHDKTTGEIDFTWLPFVDGIRSVNGIDVTENALYIVGDFLKVGGDTTNSNDPGKKDHRGFAIFKGQTH